MPERPTLPVLFFAFANDKQTEGRYLRNLTLERNELKDALKKAVQNELCEILVEPDASISTILNTFQDERYRDRIALFHYAGHADGYQLMLETREGGHEVARGGGLVSFLGSQKGLQMIFLNGCSTQQQSEELVQQGVPLVIGTANSIPDDVATLLATRFYKGLGEGHSLGRAWKEATDEAKMRKGEALYRGLDDEEEEYERDQFPWNLYHQPGSEPVLDWNLPEAGENPLFGLDLPDDPYYLRLPQAPFRGLKRFEQEHAALFFGRGKEIRTLYDKIQSIYPIILYFGQSGVGKSSLLAAGLQPRIEDRFQVRYLRREQEKGLLGSLTAGIGDIAADAPPDKAQQETEQSLAEIEALQAELDRFSQQSQTATTQRFMELMLRSLEKQKAQLAAPLSELSPLLQEWRKIEGGGEKPLILILDQVEEAFTKPMTGETAASELTALMKALKLIFGQSNTRPKGKLILAFRKEYQAEVEKALENHLLPYTKVFLSALDQDSIKDAVRGGGQDRRLSEHYQISVSPELPPELAYRLGKDEGGTIAPVLQILLQKMWEAVMEKEERVFDLELFAQFEKSMGLQDFLEEKIDHIQQLETQSGTVFYEQEVVSSGLLLDLLNQLVSLEGTAIHLQTAELKALYPHRETVVAALIDELKKENLLLEYKSESGPVIRLTHDTLARMVKLNYEASETPGQRASRILKSKLRSKVELSKTEIELVRAGEKGRQAFREEERALVQASQKQLAVDRLLETAEELMETDPIKSYRYAYFAWKRLGLEKGMGLMNELAHKMMRSAPPEHLEFKYQTLGIQGVYYSGCFSADGKRVLLAGSLDVWLYALKGEVIFTLKKRLNPESVDFMASFHPLTGQILVAESKRFLLGNEHKLTELELGVHTLGYNPSISPSGEQLLIPSDRGGMVYKMENGKVVAKPQKLPYISLQPTNSRNMQLYPHALFSPDEKYVVSNSVKHDYELVIWNLKTQKIVKRLKGHTDGIHSFSFSPDGKWLVSPSMDGTVRIWQWSPGKAGHGKCLSVIEFDPIEDQTPFLARAAVHPNGELLAVNSMSKNENRLFLLRKTAEAPLRFEIIQDIESNHDLGTKGLRESLAFSPDGRYLLDVPSHGTPKLWDLAPYWRAACQQLQTQPEIHELPTYVS